MQYLVWVGLALVSLAATVFLIRKFPTQLKKRRAEKRQAEQDEKEYWQYKRKHDAIRAKYDPRQEWNEGTSVPSEYLDEIRNLNVAHQVMLMRRNGWTAEDFKE